MTSDSEAVGRRDVTAPRRPAYIRTRLIVWMLVAVGVAVLLLGVPLAAVARQWAYNEELSQLREQAGVVERVLDGRPPEQLGMSVAISAIALDARLSVLDDRGRVLHDSLGVAPGTQFNDAVVAAARQGGAGAQVLGDQMVAAIPGEVSGTRVIIRLARPDDNVAARIGPVWLAIAALGLTALAAERRWRRGARGSSPSRWRHWRPRRATSGRATSANGRRAAASSRSTASPARWTPPPTDFAQRCSAVHRSPRTPRTSCAPR